MTPPLLEKDMKTFAPLVGTIWMSISPASTICYCNNVLYHNQPLSAQPPYTPTPYPSKQL